MPRSSSRYSSNKCASRCRTSSDRFGMTTPAGNLFVIAAPSGGGKTSLIRALLEREKSIHLSVSYTTRPPRPGELEGVDYHFVTPERFVALKDSGEFLEHAQVHG